MSENRHLVRNVIFAKLRGNKFFKSMYKLFTLNSYFRQNSMGHSDVNPRNGFQNCCFFSKYFHGKGYDCLRSAFPACIYLPYDGFSVLVECTPQRHNYLPHR